MPATSARGLSCSAQRGTFGAVVPLRCQSSSSQAEMGSGTSRSSERILSLPFLHPELLRRVGRCQSEPMDVPTWGLEDCGASLAAEGALIPQDDQTPHSRFPGGVGGRKCDSSFLQKGQKELETGNVLSMAGKSKGIMINPELTGAQIGVDILGRANTASPGEVTSRKSVTFLWTWQHWSRQGLATVELHFPKIPFKNLTKGTRRD